MVETEQERVNALSKEGGAAINVGDNAKARRLLQECMSIRQSIGDQIGVGKVLNNLAIVALQEGDEEGAKALWYQSLEMQRALNNPQGMHCPLVNLSGVAYRAGDYALMRELDEQLLAAMREISDKTYLTSTLDSLTYTAILLQAYPHARQLQQESLAIKTEMDLRDEMPSSLHRCAEIASATQDCERAALFYGAYTTQRSLLPRPQHPQEKEQVATRMAELESRMGEFAYRSAYSTGKLMTLEQAINAATAFCAVPIGGQS